MQGRTVLVTGAGGFIGGHLATRLVREGARVRALCRYNSRNDYGTLEWHDPSVVKEMEVVLGDVRDLESVSDTMNGTEVVMHLAAQIAIPYSYTNARDFVETNVLGTLNVAQAALTHGVERVVHTSTSEVYGTAQRIPIDETHPLEAQSPYAASKIGADKLMDSFHRSHQLPMVIVRPFNTYGPHQSARAVIPTIISQALAGGAVRLGSLDPRRDLTYVDDTVGGFIAAGMAPPAVLGRTMQLGTGHDISVGEIVQLVGELMGKELQVETQEKRVRPPESEVRVLVADPSLARELCGWEATVSLREGLNRTTDWIERNASRFKIDDYVI